MYKRTSQGWVKHLDFILLDVLCLQLAFFLAFFLRQHSWMPYESDFYRAVGILLTIFDILVSVMLDSMHNVMKRGYYKEAMQTFRHCAVVFLLTILWMFTLKNSDAYSRTIVFLTFVFHLLFGYGVRLLWKRYLSKHGTKSSGKLSLLAVLEPDLAEKMVGRLTGNPLDGYRLTGIVLTDNPRGLTEIGGIPIVCPFAD